MAKDNASVFKGFRSPTTTDTPNEFYDIALAEIHNLAELKVVAYVLRRTLSFDKRMDRIALSQFEFGIVTKQGHRLDSGVGMSHSNIVAGLKRAVEHGWLIKETRCPSCGRKIHATRRKGRKPHQSEFVVPMVCPNCHEKLRGKEQCFYGLHWGNPPSHLQRGEGVVLNRNYRLGDGSSKSEPGVVLKQNPQSSLYKYDVFTQISKTFANAVGVESYTPTQKDESVIAALVGEDFTEDQICAGIVRAVEIAKASNKTVRTIAYCAPVIRELSASADREAREPSAVSGKPPAVSADLADESPNATHLDSLASGDTELLALLKLAQTKNQKPLDAGDANAWSLLIAEPWVIELAQKSSVTSTMLVTQAVQEAIAGGSVTKNFLVANMARRILETWREKGRAGGNGSHPRSSRAKPAQSGAPDLNAQLRRTRELLRGE